MAEVPDTVDDAIAELSDTPTTDEVFYKTLPFQGREIASAAVSMAAAGGGGGLSALTYLGPFTVNWNTPGVNTTDVLLTSLDAETVVVMVWAFATVAWTTSTENSLNVTVDVIDDGGSNPNEVFALDVAQAPNAEREAVDSSTQIAVRRVARVPAGADDWGLRAYIFVNGAGDPTAGSYDFYALAHVPT